MEIRIRGKIVESGDLVATQIDLTIDGPDGLGRLLNACADMAERANNKEMAEEDLLKTGQA